MRKLRLDESKTSCMNTCKSMHERRFQLEPDTNSSKEIHIACLGPVIAAGKYFPPVTWSG